MFTPYITYLLSAIFKRNHNYTTIFNKNNLTEIFSTKLVFEECFQ